MKNVLQSENSNDNLQIMNNDYMYALGCYFNEVQLLQIIIKVLFEEIFFFEFVTHET